MKKYKIRLKPILLGLISLIILVLLISAARMFQSTVTIPGGDEIVASKTVWHNGVAYFPRQDIDTLLILGVDRKGPVKNSGSYRNDGLADVVMLVVFDKTIKEYSVISFNRDTMVDMPVLGVGGRQVGTDNAQLALSHTYGNGLQTSCENTAETISKLLNGIEIDYYMSMSLEAVSILNDAVGGVKVNVTDDFSAVDSTITKGEMILNGQQAINFVQLRHGVGDQLNISRMARQEEYIDGFLDAMISKIGNDPSRGLDMYEKINPYVVCNYSDRVLAEIFEMVSNFTFDRIITPSGNNVAGEKYMEFHLDKEQFNELVLRLLFEAK